MTSVLVDLALFVVYVVTSAFGLFRMKQAPELVSQGFAIGFSCYVVGFGWWLVLLRRMDLSLAFPIAAGGLIVATQIVGHVWLGEQLSKVQVVGVALIVAGIGVLFYRAA